MKIKFKRRKKIEAKFDMTPFLDVVFLLNIFFMLTATFSPMASINVELPKASTAAIVQEVKELYVTVDKNDDIRYDGKRVSVENLNDIFKREARRGNDREVIIAADKLSSHGTIVKVMELARENGLKKFSIAVKKDGKGYASL